METIAIQKDEFWEYLVDVEGELDFDIPVGYNDWFFSRYQQGVSPEQAAEWFLEVDAIWEYNQLKFAEEQGAF